MSARLVLASVLGLALAACSTMGQLTVKDYKTNSGARVMAGQAEPKAEYGCQKLAQERHEWGMSGTMNRVTATERLTTAAVEGAAARGGNYAQIMPPSETSIGGININAFKDAQAAYYRCSALPAAS
ncbi:MAG TPA: hypothetical protein VFB93_23920 [Burkholderiales bacterium]|nr:hypothetical protein [Burkholderiales bacterium]